MLIKFIKLADGSSLSKFEISLALIQFSVFDGKCWSAPFDLDSFELAVVTRERFLISALSQAEER